MDGTLPPMLSPTLPAKFGEQQLPEPLSPTLPEQFGSKTSTKSAAKSATTALASTKAPVKAKKRNTRSYSSSSDELQPKELRVDAKESKEPKEPTDPKEPTEVKAPKEKPKAAKEKVKYDQEKVDYLNSRAVFWNAQARDKKHQSDDAAGTRKHHDAAVRSVDAIICFLRQFDSVDRARVLMGKPPRIENWESMMPYLESQITYIEGIDAEIAGLLYFVRAVIGMHVAKIMHRMRLAHHPQSRVPVHQIMHNAIGDFSKGLTYLPLEALQMKYNVRWTANKRTADEMDPAADTCVVPLHVNSTIQDSAALTLRVVKEWATHESINYKWACD